MSSPSTKSNNHHNQIRSFSFPSKSNPINQRIEEELKKLRTKEESSTSVTETISIGLSGLADLYGCINEVLSLPLTQQGLSLRQHEKHIGELLKGCSRLLSVCSTMREIVLQQKEVTKGLELSLSEGKACMGIESNIASYNCARKEVIRRAKEVALSNELIGSSRLFQEDHRFSTLIKALGCISIINISVYESLLLFLSKPVSKPKRSLVAKLMNKGRRYCADHGTWNNLNDIDVALLSLLSRNKVEDEKFQIAQKGLTALVHVMESIENGLENLFKQLYKHITLQYRSHQILQVSRLNSSIAERNRINMTELLYVCLLYVLSPNIQRFRTTINSRANQYHCTNH